MRTFKLSKPEKVAVQQMQEVLAARPVPVYRFVRVPSWLAGQVKVGDLAVLQSTGTLWQIVGDTFANVCLAEDNSEYDGLSPLDVEFVGYQVVHARWR